MCAFVKVKNWAVLHKYTSDEYVVSAHIIRYL